MSVTLRQSGVFFLCAVFFTIFPVRSDAALRRAPPVPDYSTREVVSDYISDKPVCELPGSIIVSATSDSVSCFHSLLSFITYEANPENAADRGAIIEDNLKKKNIAIYTFHRFCIRNEESVAVFDENRFSHLSFLSLLEIRKPTETKESWFIRVVNKSVLFLMRILGFLGRYSIGPLRGLDPLIKTIIALTAAGILVLIALLFSRLVSRIYPEKEVCAPTLSGQSRFLNVSPSQAMESFTIGDTRESISTLYQWLIHICDHHNLVKRYEWWTNRQFSDLLTSRSPSLGRLGERIINHYEQIIYGHRSIDLSSLKELIASSLKLSADNGYFK